MKTLFVKNITSKNHKQNRSNKKHFSKYRKTKYRKGKYHKTKYRKGKYHKKIFGGAALGAGLGAGPQPIAGELQHVNQLDLGENQTPLLKAITTLEEGISILKRITSSKNTGSSYESSTRPEGAQGSEGPQGAKESEGAQGPQGAEPSFEISEVSTIIPEINSIQSSSKIKIILGRHTTYVLCDAVLKDDYYEIDLNQLKSAFDTQISSWNLFASFDITPLQQFTSFKKWVDNMEDLVKPIAPDLLKAIYRAGHSNITVERNGTPPTLNWDRRISMQELMTYLYYVELKFLFNVVDQLFNKEIIQILSSYIPSEFEKKFKMHKDYKDYLMLMKGQPLNPGAMVKSSTLEGYDDDNLKQIEKKKQDIQWAMYRLKYYILFVQEPRPPILFSNFSELDGIEEDKTKIRLKSGEGIKQITDYNCVKREIKSWGRPTVVTWYINEKKLFDESSPICLLIPKDHIDKYIVYDIKEDDQYKFAVCKSRRMRGGYAVHDVYNNLAPLKTIFHII